MWFRKILKESIPEKSRIVYEYFDVISGLALVVSIIGILIPLFFKEIETTIKWTTGVLALVVLSITWLSVRLSYKYGRLVDQAHTKDTQANILKNKIDALSSKLKQFSADSDNISHRLHNICHETRDLLTFLFGFMGPIDTAEKEKKLHIKIERFVNHFLDNTRDIYNIITQQQCAVTIKTHDLNDRENIITTYARDSISNRERGEIDKNLQEYPASNNTAFLKIISRDHEENLYVNDDLINEENEKKYKNSNINWEKYYNACLVVPIRCLAQNKDGVQVYDIFGFLCVDNKGGGFNKKISKEILSMLGDNLYCIFYMYSLIKIFRKKEGNNEDNRGCNIERSEC